MFEDLVQDFKAIEDQILSCGIVGHFMQFPQFAQIQLDCRQGLPDLIVQVTRHRATFRFLDLHQPAGEHSQSRVGFTQGRCALRHTAL